MFVYAAWTEGTSYTPPAQAAGINPSVAAANVGDFGTLTVRAFPQGIRPIMNNFGTFTVEGTFGAGIEIESITPTEGWVWASGYPMIDNSAKTFNAVTIPRVPSLIISSSVDLMTINARATSPGSPEVRLTNVRMLSLGTNRIADFNHPSTITITDAAPALPACTAADWTVGGWSICRRIIPTITCGVNAGTQNRGVTQTNTQCSGGVAAPISIQSCDLPACEPTPSTSRHDQLIAACQALREDEVPQDDWTPTFISRMARLLRDVFVAR